MSHQPALKRPTTATNSIEHSSAPKSNDETYVVYQPGDDELPQHQQPQLQQQQQQQDGGGNQNSSDAQSPRHEQAKNAHCQSAGAANSITSMAVDDETASNLPTTMSAVRGSRQRQQLNSLQQLAETALSYTARLSEPTLDHVQKCVTDTWVSSPVTQTQSTCYHRATLFSIPTVKAPPELKSTNPEPSSHRSDEKNAAAAMVVKNDRAGGNLSSHHLDFTTGYSQGAAPVECAQLLELMVGRSMGDSLQHPFARKYFSALLQEAYGLWKSAFSGTHPLPCEDRRTVTIESFVSLLLDYQKRFETERKHALESWRLKAPHLRMLYKLAVSGCESSVQSHTVGVPEAKLNVFHASCATAVTCRAMVLFEFLFVFVWLGPSTLPIAYDCPPAPIAVLHLFAQHFEPSARGDKNDLSLWKLSLPLVYFGPMSRGQAENFLRAIGGPRLVVRLPESLVYTDVHGVVHFRHRQLTASYYRTTESKRQQQVEEDHVMVENEQSLQYEHAIQYAFDRNRPDQLVEASPEQQLRYEPTFQAKAEAAEYYAKRKRKREQDEQAEETAKCARITM